MRATGGVVRMIGFGGLLVGIFDLFRHPAPKRLAESPVAAGEPKQQ